MPDTSFIGILQNAALLLSLALIFDVTALHWRYQQFFYQRIIAGLLLGATACLIMLTPWVYEPGIVFDTRSILLGISGLYFGALPTLIAMLMTAALRIYQGGAAMVMGVCVILSSGAIGIAWRSLRKKPMEDISWRELYLFGMLIHMVMLIMAFTLPLKTALGVLNSIYLPVLVIYPVGVTLLGLLLTRQLKREELSRQISESETRFRIVADYTSDWEYWLGPDGQLLYCSPSCLQITGYDRQAFIQDPSLLTHIIHPDDHSLYDAYHSGTSALNQESIEFRILRADQSVRWIGHICIPVFDERGKYKGLRVSDRDITKRKESEEALRRTNEMSREIVKAFPSGLFIYQYEPPDRLILLTGNAESERLTGMHIADITGKEFTELFPAAKSLGILQQYLEVIHTGKTYSHEDLIYNDAAISRVFSIRAFLLPEKRLAVAFEDVSQRKQAEEAMQAVQAELQRLLSEAEQSRRLLLSVVEDEKRAKEQINELNNQLEQRVSERTAQLQEANKELVAFSYSVSHDLRAPLRAVDGYSALLLEEYENHLDAQGKHYLAQIREASKRMAQLINDLLSLSRVTRSEFKRQAIDLSAMAQEIATEIQTQNGQRQVIFNIAPDLKANGDAHLMRIALSNLMQNAHKFTNKRAEAVITIGKCEKDGEQVFFVRDNGAGFDMAYADKLFTPFQRLHGIQEYPGTGIGLSLVQRIITRHGGRIWPQAALDQGATFYFTLNN